MSALYRKDSVKKIAQPRIEKKKKKEKSSADAKSTQVVISKMQENQIKIVNPELNRSWSLKDFKKIQGIEPRRKNSIDDVSISDLPQHLEEEIKADDSLDPRKKKLRSLSQLAIPKETIKENMANPKLEELMYQELNNVKNAYKKFQTQYLHLLENSPVKITANKGIELRILAKNLMHTTNQMLAHSDQQTFEIIDIKHKRPSKFHVGSSKEPMPDFFQEADNDHSKYAELKHAINKELKENIIINTEDSLIKSDNKRIFINSIAEGAKLISEINDAQNGDPMIYYQKRLQLLLTYKKTIKEMCEILDALSKEKKLEEHRKIMGNYSLSLQLILSNITRKMTSYDAKNTQKPSDEISDDVQSLFRDLSRWIGAKFLEISLDKKILAEIHSLVEICEKQVPISKKKPPVYFYPKLVQEIENGFNEMSIKGMDVELERAILGGWTQIVDQDENEIQKPFVKIKDEDPLKTEGRIADYFKTRFNKFSTFIFKDEVLLWNVLLHIETVADESSPALKNPEYTFQKQARLFNTISEQLKDPQKKEEFLNNLQTYLLENNPDSIKRFTVEQILAHLLQIYRSFYQGFMWGATGSVEEMHKKITSSQTKIIEKLEEERPDGDSKKILTIMRESFIEYHFLRRGRIGELECLCIQNLTIRVPMPNIPKFKAPVSIQFYYEYPELPKETEKEIRTLLESFDLTLRGLLFPTLLRMKPAPHKKTKKQTTLSL